MRYALLLAGLFAQTLFAAEAPPEYSALKADAEKLYAEKSFSKAHALYAQAREMSNISSNDARWVSFRFYDTQWRAAAGSQTADETQLQSARTELEKFVRDVNRTEDQDLIWVEVQESLGDWWWTRRHNQNWGQGWQYYQRALDWWAGARDVERARDRYLAIVWRCAKPPQVEPYYHYGYFGNYLDQPILENALKIAKSEQDQAHAHYLLAMTLRNRGAGDAEQRQRVQDEFEVALKLGTRTDWYDDALFNYAQWIGGEGRVVILKDGNWRSEPDHVRALELYRRLVSEFKKGETRYWEQAQQAIKEITDPQLHVLVSEFFLPGSELQYALNWRNVKQIELALYPVELNRDVKFGDNRRDWVEEISLAGREKLKSWTYDAAGRAGSPLPAGGTNTNSGAQGTARPTNDYKPGNATVRLEEKLPPGAYLLEGKAGGRTSRQLILVTEAALVLKSSGKQALVYFCNALSGAPLANAKVVLRERWHANNKWNTSEQAGVTDADGLAKFGLEKRENTSRELFASAMLTDKQAFSLGNTWWNNWRAGEPWKIYAFTDRPAYRPKETVNWKFLARRYADGVYSTPANQTVEFEITDPRGTKVKEGRATLNSFGSAWGNLELTEQTPLGEYRVTFWDEGRKHTIGNATLFRLEEYKLPEFKVAVSTPEERSAGGSPAQKKTYRLGDTVEVTIQADYYFGGPVANANVEVVVNQNPYWQQWAKPREFPWFYEDMDQGGNRGRWWGGGQIVKRETVKTDATGKATLTFESPKGGGQDLEYRIEARVTDSSRREIVGSGTVRVTRQRYFVHADADHRLYKPQDKATVEFKAADANQQPVVCEGTVKVTRDYWWEIWIAPDGREVKGDELKQQRARTTIWPPPPTKPNEPGWRLKFSGYEHDEILTKSLKTDTNGTAQLEFKPEREGYYRIAWTSEDEVAKKKLQVANPIKAETTVWVCTDKSTELGYRTGGLELIVDKDTFRVGQKAPVMIQTADNDRYVLFTVEADELLSAKLIHLDGTVKLVELDVTEQHVPNMFLNAAMVSSKQLFIDTKQVVVPPTKNFLTVDVKPDRAQYQPREEGTFTVTTRDDQGKPVAAEVALSLVDESVFYIQSDYAGDPRQFYFGTKRPQTTQTGSTFNQRRYVKFVRVDDTLIDEKEVEAYELRKKGQARNEFESRNGWDAERMDMVNSFDQDGSAVMFERAGGMGGGGGGARTRRQAGAMTLSGMAVNAPATAAPMAAGEFKSENAKLAAAEMPAQPPGEEGPAVVVRSDFRSTILWQPDVATDASGKATVKVTYPDSLTGWKATARATSSGNQFGIADAATRTKQPLIVRLQAPRFFVVGDTVTISAVINNNTDQALSTKVQIEADGLKLLSVNTGPHQDPISSWIPQPKVPANSESRVDWSFKVEKPGPVRIKVSGRGGKFSDGMEKTYIAHDHGIEKFIAKSGKVRGNDVTVKLDLPARKAESTKLTVQVTPSLAVTMLDALPYLIDYPYGCTEQTMSRFLPATIVAKTLKDAGLQPEDVMGRVFGGIETNSAAATHPKGKQDLAKLDDMTKAGLDRLYDFQHSDGGWGWWKEGQSDHWMTAYVVWGLSLANQAGVAVKPEVARRGAEFLDKTLVEQEENQDLQAFMLHALAAHKAAQNEAGLSKLEAKAFDNLWVSREKLNAYTRSLLALSAHYFGKTAEAKTLIENLENGVKRDDRPDLSVLVKPETRDPKPETVLGTAHWGEDGIYWRWSDGGVEATAFALRALLAIDPTNKLVEPTANWLIKNRRGAQWSNTRDTAIVVLAMTDYLKVSGELAPDLEYVLTVNGTKVASKKVSGADVFNAPSRFAVDAKLIKDSNEVRIQVKPGKPTPSPSKEGNRQGGTPVYFAVEAQFFSLEEPIAAAGNEIFVKREYFKLVGRPTLLKGYVYVKEPLRDGESVKSGERVETVLTIEGKNNYEYLLFEDLKPAGFEAVDIRSGESLHAKELKSGAVARKHGESTVSGQSPTASKAEVTPPVSRERARNTAQISGRRVIRPRPQPAPEDSDYTGRTRWVYQELRDRKVAMFIDKLPEGVWEIRYDLRAEVPGEFHALPVLGHAMYVPEIRCNGAELQVKVEDAN
jgi:uncharacterized protein YfaS (alpha-2-macroglobulin family)